MKPKKPICQTYANGDKVWYLNGKCHREDGPAIEHTDGYKAWWLNGMLHREDGPAIEYANGDKVWYLNGKRYYSEPDFYKQLYKLGKITKEELFIKLI